MKLPFGFAPGVAVLCLTALASVACSRHERYRYREAHRESESLPLDKMDHLRVEIRMGAGELRVKGGSEKLVEADFEYGDKKPIVRYSPGSMSGQLIIEEPHEIDFDNGPNDWNLRLNDSVPTEILTKLGAGNAELRLGSLALRNLEIRMGVGNLDLDLRGAPKHDYDVEIKGGVGNATVRLPAGVDIVANASGGIGNIDAHGLEKHNGQWVNTAHTGGSAKAAIHLNIRGGVGNIDLIVE